MARIIITTDEGELIDTLVDTAEADDSLIGDLDKRFNRDRCMAEIARAVKLARQKDRRKPDGSK